MNNKHSLARSEKLILGDEVYAIVGAAMEVHNTLGSGFLEAVYQEALEIELAARSIPFVSQPRLPVWYKGHQLSQIYIADILAYDKIVVELKAVSALTPAHKAQLINYLKASEHKVGVMANFGNAKLEWFRKVF